MATTSPYLFRGVPRFDARGLRRCVVPGVCVQLTSTSVADWWRHPDGSIKLRIGWMGWDWSFEARFASGEPVPDERAAIEEFAWAVQEELYRWMTEDAADVTPFDDDN